MGATATWRSWDLEEGPGDGGLEVTISLDFKASGSASVEEAICVDEPELKCKQKCKLKLNVEVEQVDATRRHARQVDAHHMLRSAMRVYREALRGSLPVRPQGSFNACIACQGHWITIHRARRTTVILQLYSRHSAGKSTQRTQLTNSERSIM